MFSHTSCHGQIEARSVILVSFCPFIDVLHGRKETHRNLYWNGVVPDQSSNKINQICRAWRTLDPSYPCFQLKSNKQTR